QLEVLLDAGTVLQLPGVLADVEGEDVLVGRERVGLLEANDRVVEVALVVSGLRLGEQTLGPAEPIVRRQGAGVRRLRRSSSTATSRRRRRRPGPGGLSQSRAQKDRQRRSQDRHGTGLVSLE